MSLEVVLVIIVVVYLYIRPMYLDRCVKSVRRVIDDNLNGIHFDIIKEFNLKNEITLLEYEDNDKKKNALVAYIKTRWAKLKDDRKLTVNMHTYNVSIG